MAADRDSLLQLSLLDRLIDSQPDSRSDAPVTGRQSLTQVRAAVRRDLEALLNARARYRAWPDSLGEIGRSVVSYGLPDRAVAAMSGGHWRERLRKAIEDAIRKFEPRLIGVVVTVIDDASGIDRSIRFRIEATINLDPAPEPVTFDSQLDPTTNVVLVADR
ncbi:MAG: type VI secretion system baseplate subunit TssE [Alphaproteobacteria bacterium]|nr:type VI secretion system baseplate subunit TssE [Alphaproteobacteria bacterium]